MQHHHSPKPSHGSSVLGFFGPPVPWLAFCEHTTPPPPLPHMHHHHTPTQCPPSRFHAARLKPSHSSSVSDFGPTTRSLPPVSRTRDPTTTTTLYRPPPHPYATSSVAVSIGATETEPQWLGFGLLTKPTPCLPFCERMTPPPPLPCTDHHPTPTHCPPLPFHMACQKPSPSSSVSDFGPKPTPRLAFRKRTTPPPSPPHPPHCTTSLHCSSPPFPLACLQLSSSGSVSDS